MWMTNLVRLLRSYTFLLHCGRINILQFLECLAEVQFS